MDFVKSRLRAFAWIGYSRSEKKKSIPSSPKIWIRNLLWQRVPDQEVSTPEESIRVDEPPSKQLIRPS